MINEYQVTKICLERKTENKRIITARWASRTHRNRDLVYVTWTYQIEQSYRSVARGRRRKMHRPARAVNQSRAKLTE